MGNRIVAIGIVLLLWGVALVTAQTADDLYRQALNKEQVGDCDGAIQIYERIVRDSASRSVVDKDLHQLVAKAKVHMGDCWIKKADADESKGMGILNDVIANYKDVGDMVREATRLVALTRAAAQAGGAPIQIATPFTNDAYSFAISPDGRRLVFLATVAGKTSLWLRELDSQKQGPITGTESLRYAAPTSGANPFWSPDGRFIAYFDDQKLKKIPVGGGIAKILTDAPRNARGTWNSDGEIVFAPDLFGRLYRISEDGGSAVALRLEPQAGGNYRYPQFLSDGRLLIFAGRNTGASGTWFIGSLNSLETRDLALQSNGAAFAPPDHLFFATGGTLYGQSLDLQRTELTGSPVHIADRIASFGTSGSGGSGFSALSVSAKGPAAYRADVSVRRRLIWFDRMGRETGALTPAALTGLSGTPRFSPDGRSVAVNQSGQALLIDLADGKTRQLSFSIGSGAASPSSPVWSFDGTFLAFGAINALPYYDIFLRSVSVELPASRMLQTGENKGPVDWYGDFLLFTTTNQNTNRDLLVLPVQGRDFRVSAATPTDNMLLRAFLGAGAPIPVAATSAQESNGRFSPNGTWIAYESDEVGERNEIFVQPFPGTPAARTRISTKGGNSPEWSRDGRELYFLSADNHLMVVAITLPTNGQAIVTGEPRLQFPSPLPDGSTYAPSPDGQRFLVNAPIEPVPPIFVLSIGATGKK